MKFFYISFSFKLFILLIQLFSTLSILSEVNNEVIELTEKGFQKRYDEIKNRAVFRVQGNINSNDKFILIEAFSKDKINPYLSVTKKENFSEEKEYDYYSIQDIPSKGTKLILPTSYFSLEKKEGFNLHLICKNDCGKTDIQISTTSVINLSLDQKISYFSKEKQKNFQIKLNSVFSFKEVAFILIGGNKKQLMMEFDSKMAKEELDNVLVIKSKKSDGIVEIFNFEKNINFFFFSHEIKSNHIIYENEYNQYFMIEKNKETNFNVEKPNKYSENEENFKERRISVISQRKVKISITCEKGDIFKTELKGKETENISEELYCKGPVSSVTLSSYSENSDFLVKIMIEKKGKNNKMAEPLIPNIYQRYNLDRGNGTSNINIHTYDNSLHNKDKIEYIDRYIGIQFDMTLKSNTKLKVYRALCKTYPFCSKENAKHLTQLFPISGHLSETFYAMNNTHPNSNHRNIIIVECEKKKDSNRTCEYELGYHKIEKFRKLKYNKALIKYLPNLDKKIKNAKETIFKEESEDKYTISLNNKNKVILDLMVYSGDALLISDDPKLNDYNCKHEKYYFGQSQRWILYCKNDYENSQFDYKIKVRSNSFGAVYNIYAQKVKDIYNRFYSFELSTLNIIQHKINITLIADNNNSKNFINTFNPINCDLKIKNMNKNDNSEPIITKGQDPIFDFGTVNKSITYSIEPDKHTHLSDKKCLFFLSSQFYEYDSSYSILPEANPFRVLLNSKIKIAKLIFPYISRNESNQVLLRVNLYNLCPLKVTIKIGSDKDKVYFIMQSKNIIINKGNFTKFQIDKIYPIIIKLEYVGNENQEIMIDLNIKTEADIPYSIKSEEFFSDIVMNNNFKYYMAVVGKNSIGSVLLNFKRGTGVIYARLIESKDTNEVDGWNNRIELPNENTKDLLKFNFFEQKLNFDEADTAKCKNNCYLVIGVKQKQIININNIESNNFFSEYSLFLRYFNKNETDINFIDIQNDDFIVNNINVEKNKFDYFDFNFPIQNSVNSLIIEYKSENCRMTLSFNSTNFEDKNNTITINRDPNSQMIKINKDKFISKHNQDKEGYLKIYIRIDIEDERKDYAVFNSLYKFRIKATIDMLEDVITADTNLPVYCDTKLLKRKNKKYCDFLININEYEYIESLGLYAMHTEKNNTKIYGKLIDSNNFTNSLFDKNLVSWPNETDNQFHTENNYLLKISIQQNKSFKLLIRIYIKENSSIELITNVNRKNNLLVPFPTYFQLMEVNNTELQMIIKSGNSYNIHFINLEGKGEFNFNNNNFELYGEFDTLVFNTKSETLNNITLKSSHKSFICYMRYSKTDEDVPLERLTLNSGADYVYNEKNDDFYYYFIVNHTEQNIFFNLVFNTINSSAKEFRDKNVKKDFNITGYFTNEEGLLAIQQNKSHITSLKTKYEGNYDPSHHLGSIIFDSNDLKQFYYSNKNNPFYILIIIKKNKEDKNEYIKYIYSSIAIFSPNDKRTAPNYLLIANHFEKNTNNSKHYYNINAYKNMEKMYLDFSSPNKNLKYAIVKDKIKKIEDINQTEINKYFDIEKVQTQEKVGKDLLIIRKNLENAILYIDCKDCQKEKVDYTFRYFIEQNYTYQYEYDNTIKIDSQKNKFINISFDRIKSSITKDYVKSNYYIKVYEYKNEDNKDSYYDLSTSYSDEKPYLIYKLTSDDNILKSNNSLKFEIDIKNLKNYFIDVIAEIVDITVLYDYLAYKRYYYIDESSNIPKAVIYVCVGIAGTVLILGLCFIFCICFYRKSNKTLTRKVNKISFIIGEDNPYIKSDRGKYDVIEYDDDDENDF